MPVQQVTLNDLYARASADADLFEAVINGRANVNAALEPYHIRLSTHDAESLQEGLARVAPSAVDFNNLPAALGGWGPWRARKVKILL